MNWLEQARERIGIVPPVERDNHHLLYPARAWNTYGVGLDVRNRIIAHGMSRVVHNLLHENEAPVPVPEYHSLVHVYGNLSKGLDVFTAIDKYCLLLDRANKHPKIKPLEIQLNDLSILAVRNQLPYLRDGMSRRSR